MPLLGQAAMLLSFDVVQEAIPEHDEWHTHEHFPERLAIPCKHTGVIKLNGVQLFFFSTNKKTLNESKSLFPLLLLLMIKRLRHGDPIQPCGEFRISLK